MCRPADNFEIGFIVTLIANLYNLAFDIDLIITQLFFELGKIFIFIYRYGIQLINLSAGQLSGIQDPGPDE